MGCAASSPQGGPENEKPDKSTKQQRRLSVMPGILNNDNGDEYGEDDSAETELQKEARKLLPNGTVSLKGMVPHSNKKVNQDSPVVKYCLKGDANMHLFGVMDGHGQFGHKISQFVRKELPLCLEAEDLRADPHKAITDGVKNLVDKLQATNIDCTYSGTTCVFSVAIDNKFYTANIGDSRCIVCKTAKTPWTSLDLSIDQKPDSDGEKERILAAGGRVDTLPGPPGEDCGPQRVWLANEMVPGLAMSRSIGDEVAQQAGVISVPIIQEYVIETGDLFIWASDGVWEFLESPVVCEIVARELASKPDDVQTAAKTLSKLSSEEWKKEEEVIDDITCVILKWKQPPV